jgi:hypothetical protein
MLRSGRLEKPAKDSSGDFVWTEDDLQRARRVLDAEKDRELATAKLGAMQ